MVLDTSGVGDITQLVDVLKENHVHVRISLDAISPTNDLSRPINKNYVDSGESARVFAERAIEICIKNDIPVTVQTVICSLTENESELMDLRNSLVAWGVKHWVLHIAVRGGNARVLEDLAEKQTRKRGILPSSEVYKLVHKIIEGNETSGNPIDIRCTDTENTPNSVLLIGSKGDLYTEGLAHNGKVVLYDAQLGKPDELRSQWHYVDKFGHARRYLNWNQWLAQKTNLEDLCVKVEISGKPATPSAIVENLSLIHI